MFVLFCFSGSLGFLLISQHRVCTFMAMYPKSQSTKRMVIPNSVLCVTPTYKLLLMFQSVVSGWFSVKRPPPPCLHQGNALFLVPFIPNCVLDTFGGKAWHRQLTASGLLDPGPAFNKLVSKTKVKCIT